MSEVSRLKPNLMHKENQQIYLCKNVCQNQNNKYWTIFFFLFHLAKTNETTKIHRSKHPLLQTAIVVTLLTIVGILLIMSGYR